MNIMNQEPYREPESYVKPFTRFESKKYNEANIKPEKHHNAGPFSYQHEPVFVSEPYHEPKPIKISHPKPNHNQPSFQPHHSHADIHTQHFGPDSFPPSSPSFPSPSSADRDGAR